MSNKTSGSFSTLLLSLPLAGVALMAIFGVPQFAPVVASPDDEEVVRSPAGHENRHDRAEDFFEEFPTVRYGDEAPMFGSQVPRNPSRDANARPPARSDLRRPDQPSEGWGALSPADSGSQENWSERAGEVNWLSATVPTDTVPGHASRARPVDWDDESPRDVSSATAMPAAGDQHPWPIQPSGPAGGPLGWRAASRRLAELGIEKYHLERGESEGSFLFVCLFSQASSPNVLHRFEAESGDPLIAVNDVLQQIDNWLRARFANRDPAPLRTSSL